MIDLTHLTFAGKLPSSGAQNRLILSLLMFTLSVRRPVNRSRAALTVSSGSSGVLGDLVLAFTGEKMSAESLQYVHVSA